MTGDTRIRAIRGIPSFTSINDDKIIPDLRPGDERTIPSKQAEILINAGVAVKVPIRDVPEFKTATLTDEEKKQRKVEKDYDDMRVLERVAIQDRMQDLLSESQRAKETGPEPIGIKESVDMPALVVNSETDELTTFLVSLSPDLRADVEKYSGLPSGELVKPSEIRAAGILKQFQSQHETVPAGTRNTVLFKYSCLLRRCGLGAGAILEALWNFSDEHCQPPHDRIVDAQELTSLAERAYKFVKVGFPRMKTDVPKQRIKVNNQSFDVVMGLSLDALLNYNATHGDIFVRSGSLCRVIHDENGSPTINEYTADSISEVVSLAAEFYKTSVKKVRGDDDKIDDEIFADTVVFPQKDVLRALIARKNYPGIPPLTGITTTPFILPDGSIFDTPGYDKQTGLYYLPTAGFSLPEIPVRPTNEDVKKAVDLLKEIIEDFPFENDASRDNAISGICTPVLRPLIDGSIPAFLVDKPQAGTGASLLSTTIGLIANARYPTVKNAPRTEEEWQKAIMTIMRSGNPLVVFDNLTGKLFSEALAAVLTARRYGGRLLGGNDEGDFLNNTVFIINGNNIVLGGDLPRRCYRSRINANMARPWTREVFKHDPLETWVLQERGSIIAAILTMARYWIQSGNPVSATLPKVGGFDQWRAVVGGMLTHCGVSSFLSDLDVLYTEADDDSQQWNVFIERLYTIYGEESFTVAKIIKQIDDEISSTSPTGKQLCFPDGSVPNTIADVLPDQIADSGKNKSRVVGRQLIKRVDVVFPNGYTLKRGDVDHHAITYRILKNNVGRGVTK